MATLYSRRGTSYWVTSDEDQDLMPTLPARTFVVDRDPKIMEFFLRTIDDLPAPARVYGDLEQKAARVLTTFTQRPHSTGVLLAGSKGGGKSLLARLVSRKAADAGIPTFIVNTPYGGDPFNRFVQSIHQPAVLLFDEFEKVYPIAPRDPDDDESEQPRSTQQQLLTLLDGTFPTKKLFVLTANDRYKVDPNFINRPGRLFYFLEFGGVSREFIAEYCRDHLKDPAQAHTIEALIGVLGSLNFDQLQAVVEEMNRYGLSAKDALEMLNVKPDRGSGQFKVFLERAGRKLDTAGNDTRYVNPFKDAVDVSYKADKDKWETLRFFPADLAHVDAPAGRYVYERDGYRLTLTEAVAGGIGLHSLLGG